MKKMTKKTLLFLVAALCLAFSLQAKEKRSVVRIETSEGIIRVALFDDTPIHRDNFLDLASSGFYDGLLFHRVIQDFMIQAGDPNSRHAEPGMKLGGGDNGYTLVPEFKVPVLYHWRGALAAAREGDDVNPEMRSSGCQFYIVYGKKQSPADIRKASEKLEKNDVTLTSEMIYEYEHKGGVPHLDGTYTVFGEVIEGMDVVRHIQLVSTDENDRPLEDVVIRKMVVEQRSKEALADKSRRQRRK